MKLSVIAFAGFSILIVSVLTVGLIVVKPALAQVDATSTETVAITSEPATAEEAPAETVAGTAPDATEELPSDDADIIATPASSPEAASETLVEPPPEGLTEVHIIGTKYTDYFTDGATVTSYPGDPEIHAHIAEPNAPIPTHEGLTWVHSTGSYLYDTSSGDLEEGQYAMQPNGSYIEKRPPFVSSTSTPAVSGESTSASGTPPDNSSTITTTSDPAETNSPTTTSTGTATTSSNTQ
ncbi:hypothetical protein [Bradyrhizobium icense]|uniref:hypothetical protein n=1 Tax=Bradyrhizobium icense TaxID=1274631 RepID=UPI000AD4063D|nr:hypothetical protein [Bradyrhizobium icense]